MQAIVTSPTIRAIVLTMTALVAGLMAYFVLHAHLSWHRKSDRAAIIGFVWIILVQLANICLLLAQY